MEKSCKDYTMIWNPVITKSKLLLFQLVRKEHGTKEIEFGSLLPTPQLDDGKNVNPSPKRRMTLAKYIKMYPTPRNSEWKDCGQFGSKSQKYMAKKKYLCGVVKTKNNPGGKLNPNFVEFLMGYNTNYTKIELTELKHLETQLFPKSQQKSEKQLSKQRNKNDR